MKCTNKIAAYANMIDHTNLKPFTTKDDWWELCAQAQEHGFKSVAINNAGIVYCKEFLADRNILVDAAVGFPLGQNTLAVKVFETMDAIEKGADEIDYVVNISEVKNGNWQYVTGEMIAIVKTCRARNITCKVIFENCYLTDDEKKQLCEIALRICPDFIKTSTGFGTGGATVADVVLMKACVRDDIQIKAAGGIRTAQQFLAMIEAGATRIGTSSGIAIMQELRKISGELA
jgi:deoxyribose-phosphate aldolase